MDSVLNTKEICQQIFSLDINNNEIPSDLSEDAKNFIHQLEKNFPDDSTIRLFLKELKTEPIANVINKYSFPIQNSLLEKVLKEKQLFNKVFKIFSLYTFYTWISTTLLFFKKQQNDISVLLAILNYMIQISTNVPERNLYRTISISCFVDIIKTATENDCIADYSDVFGEMSDFFIENTQLLNHSDEIIKILSEKLLTSECELNTISIALLSSITIILNRNPHVINQSIVFSVLRLIQSQIINLDRICLKLFLNAAGLIKTDDFIKIFKPLMIQTLTNVVRSHEEFYQKEVKKEEEITDEEKKQSNLKIFEPNNSDYFHPPPDLYQINKVNDSNFTVQFKAKQLSSFISSDLLPIVLTIEKIILLKEEYAQYFLTESIVDLKTLDSSIDLYKGSKSHNEGIFHQKRIFYEQCIIMFYLVSSAIKKYSNITIQDPTGLRCPLFNNKHIFDPKITYFNAVKDPNFDIIDSLRHFTFLFLLEKFQPSLNDILIENSGYLDLFRECVCRLISIQNNENENNKTQLSKLINFENGKFENEKEKVGIIQSSSLKNEQSLNYRLCSLADTLISLFVAYRIISDPPDPRNDNNLILTIRKTILIYFNSFLSCDYILNVVFISPIFLNHFFVLLMEPPIRQQFIGFLLKYLSSIDLNEKLNYQQEKNTNSSFLPDLCQSIITLFNVSCKELPQNEALSLLSDVLNSLNEALVFNKSLTFILEPISSELCHNIMSINVTSGETEKMEDLLLSLISFLAATSHDKTIQANDISLLESTIVHLTKTKPQSKIMQKLVQVIAGKQISFILPTFEIKQSKVLCSFVRIFLETNHIYKVVKFISDLCTYSSENCIKCHDGELDLLLIDIITKWRKTIIEVVPSKPETAKSKSTAEIDLNTNYFNDTKNDDSEIIIKKVEDNENPEKNGLIISEKLVDLFLDLLAQISTVISSVSVVQRFFSMLCPIDAKYLSPIHKNIINSLNKILIDSRYFPLAALPMLQSSKVIVHNIPALSFDNGMSFVLWISMPSTLPDDYSHNIIVLDDGKKHRFKAKLKGKVLRVKIQSGSDFYHYDFALNIPIKTWTMITMTSTPNPNNNQESSVTLYVNKEQVKVILKFALFSPKATIECTINSSKKLSKVKKFDPPLMGPFILAKQLLPEEIAALSDEGPRPTLSSCSEKIVFAYTPQYCGKYFSFIPIQKYEEINETHQQIVSHKKSLSFFDLIMNYCKVYLILPIFGQLDIPLKDGSYFPFMADLGVEILANLFYLGEQVQYSFFTYNSFFAIAHLLQYSDKSHITFNLYMRYFNLLGMISYKNLQMQLIDAILLNFDLWFRSEIKHQVRIFKHWSRTVYIPFKNMIDPIRPLEWFIFIIHNNYYTVTPDCDERILFECRKSLFEIVRESYKSTLTLNQVSIIIKLICDTKETSLIEKKEMTDLLFLMLQNEKSVIKAGIIVSYIIPYLFTIFELPEKDDEIICKVITLFISIYKLKKYEMNIPFQNIIQVIITNLIANQRYLIHEEFFSNLISLMNANKVVELLPLLCVFSILGGSKYIEKLLNDIDRKIEFGPSDQCAVYSSLLLFAFSSSPLYAKIMKLNIDLFENNWDNLVNAVTVIGYSFFDPDVADNIKHDVLYKLTRKAQITRDESYNLIRTIRDFIFFRLEGSTTSILTNILNKKPLMMRTAEDPENDDIEVNISDNSENSSSTASASHADSPIIPSSLQSKFVLPGSDTKAIMSALSSRRGSSLYSISSDFNAPENCIPDVVDRILNSIKDMNELISKTVNNQLKNKSFKFGLRFGRNSEKWSDLDLGKKALTLYAHNNVVQLTDKMMTLAHFVYRMDENYVIKIADSMSTNFVLYPENQAYMKNEVKNVSFFTKIEQSLLSYDDTLNYQVLVFADKISKFLNSCLNNEDLTVADNKIKELNEFYIKAQLNFFTVKNENMINKNKKIWSHLWRSLTITRAPWADSLTKAEREGFRRDNSFCFAYCPYKVRKISKFDTHKRASLIRDIGDKKKAQQRYLEMINNEQPKSLLFCASQKDNSDNNNSNNNGSNKSHNNTQQEKFVRLETLEELPCKLVTIKGEKNAQIKIDNKTIIITTFPDQKTTVIASDSIHSIFYVFKFHQYSGIQIFTKMRENFFLIFSGNLFRSLAMRIRLMPSINLERIQSINPKQWIQTLHITDQWSEGKMSNFEYLMYLNILSGRSFNDATQYPIFPWILNDYKSDKLDLDSETVYRDLSKPIGAIDDERLKELLMRCEEIKEIEKSSYLYASGYSNPLSVYLWLIRLEPFTTQHIDIQGGKFDYAARIFRSIGDSYHNATTSQNDFRELIPEFFFLPEFLKNISQFDLGKTDDGVVGDVKLPPWANNSAIEFIYLHRKALESDYVSAHLNEWIDLIWGNKQDGNEAVKAHNVFRAEMYETIWKKMKIEYKDIVKSEDPFIKEIKAIQTNVGQIPLKLFDEKHPKRNVRSKSFVQKSSIKNFDGPISAMPLSSSSSTSLATYATTMDSISPTVSSTPTIQSSSSQSLNINIKDDNKNKMNNINSQIHHSIVKFFEVSSMASADVVLLPLKGKLSFNILDNKGNLFLYSCDFTLFKSQKFVIKSKSSKRIKTDLDESNSSSNSSNNNNNNSNDNSPNNSSGNINLGSAGNSSEKIDVNPTIGGKINPSSSTTISNKLLKSASKSKINKVSFDGSVKGPATQSILSPMFIDNKRLCFVDKNSSMVKIVNTTSGVVEKNIEQNFGIVAIETNPDGWLAISAKDAAVTVYNVNHLPTSITTISPETTSMPTEATKSNSSSENLTEFSSQYDFSKASSNSDSVVYSGTISSFRESIKCIAINPTFDALICGTRDNWLLFCKLNVLKMNVNRMVETEGRPQNIIVTDVFGFVAVSVTKIENGDLMEKLVLYSINGELIRSTQWDANRRIVAMTKASSLPGAFDFLIVADDSNCIFVFEAYYLNFGEPIFKCNSKIKKLTYIKEESLLIAFCEDGSAAVIYKPIVL